MILKSDRSKNYMSIEPIHFGIAVGAIIILIIVTTTALYLMIKKRTAQSVPVHPVIQAGR